MTTPVTTLSVSHQKVDIEADYKTLIVGLNTELGNVDTLIIAGQTIARTDLVTRFQARVDAADAVKAGRVGLQNLVAHERAVDAETRPLRAATKVFLQGRYGKNSPKLQAFGFTQSRKAKASAATKATAQVKAKATRATLGTKGKQQKKASKKAAAAAPATAPTTVSGTSGGTGPAGTHT
jgi:hypothetical protein